EKPTSPPLRGGRKELARRAPCGRLGGSSLPHGRSSEGQHGAELDHAAVLNQRGLEPQWAIVGVFHQNGAAVENVVDVQIPLEPDSLRQLEAFSQPQVESRVPVFPHRLRNDQRSRGGVRARTSGTAGRQAAAQCSYYLTVG